MGKGSSYPVGRAFLKGGGGEKDDGGEKKKHAPVQRPRLSRARTRPVVLEGKEGVRVVVLSDTLNSAAATAPGGGPGTGRGQGARAAGRKRQKRHAADSGREPWGVHFPRPWGSQTRHAGAPQMPAWAPEPLTAGGGRILGRFLVEGRKKKKGGEGKGRAHHPRAALFFFSARPHSRALVSGRRLLNG